LREHQLYAKGSKYEFSTTKIEYLGHIISLDGVATEPSKIAAMVNWLVPKTLRQLRGFLGLTRYYRKLIRNYGIISRPLSDLLKKDAFKWSAFAQTTFDDLKTVMSNAPTRFF
jgi:hypothetical protein